jgi:Fibronectin type III domain
MDDQVSLKRRTTGAAVRRRLPMALLVAAVVAGVVVAVTAAGKPVPGLHLAQGGHWVAVPGTGRVFHINGAARTVDASAEVLGLQPGSQVVQGETSGYVVGHSRIYEFGKSSLSVEQSLTPPTGELPVAIETPGGPYLVYREAGRVVRLGESSATIPAGGVLGDPVATPDGTLWLHRLDSGVLCQLRPDAEQVSCPAVAPSGHSGSLAVVGRQAAFLDSTSDTLRLVSGDGLGEPVPLRMDVPPNAKVSPVDAGGRVAVLDPSTRRLHLVDAAGLDPRRAPAAPITVALADGDYAGPTVSGSSVVLLDLTRSAVLTYSSHGEVQKSMPVPQEAGEPRLARGEDARVYVDGAEGRHVMMVDHDGAVNQVPVVGAERDGASVPVAPPPEAALPVTQTQNPNPGQSGNRQPDDRQPDQRGAKPQPNTSRTPPPGPSTRPPLPASPPGLPPGFRATVQGADVVLAWGAAAPNGAPVTAYQISWKPASGAGGSMTRPGSARSATLTGLAPGVAYTITVVAENSAGRGTPATARATVPSNSTPVVTVKRGDTESHDAGCRPPDCGLMRFELKGFKPRTDYTITPHSNDPNYRGDNPEDGATTNGNGYYTDQAFPFSRVGYDVWVVVEGPNGERYESNHFTWVSG